MKIKLKDGRSVQIVPLNSKIPVRAFLKFINDIADENTYVLHDRHYTYKEEKKWKAEQLKKIRKKEIIAFIALFGKRVVCIVGARKGRMKWAENVDLGISVSRDFRGVGLGEKMLRFIIAETKKKFKPRNIWLTVVAENKRALSLYKKLGFRKLIARYPKWFKHKGRYIDHLALLSVEK